VAKLDTTKTGGDSLVYSTYLGGASNDEGHGIAVDSSGKAHVTGYTDSSDFPIQGAYQTDQSGTDTFVTKLNSDGDGLVYSTYLGGGDDDYGRGIAVDSSGNAYVTGNTDSSNFPTQGQYQADQGSDDAFVTKIDTGQTGNDSLIYSTYLGGGDNDYGYGIAVDSSGNAYVTGYTQSSDFPTAGLIQTTNAGGRDAFITKLNPSGSALTYSTYLGGGNDDEGYGIAVDSLGNAYVTGYTLSGDFNTENPSQAANAGGSDVIVAKIGGFPDIAISPTTIAFGNVCAGISSSAQTITVTNDGQTDLDMGTLSLAGTNQTEFDIQNDTCSDQSIAPGNNCTVQVIFSPLSEDSKTANLAIPSNDPDTPTESVTLSGNGNPGVIITSTDSTISGVAICDSTPGAPGFFTCQCVVNFTATGVNNTARISMAFTSLPANNAFYKVVNGAWTQIYPTNQVNGISDVALNGNTLSFTIADNSDSDTDPTVGTILDPVAAGSLAEGSGGRLNVNCFIATTAYGSPLAPHVMLLRQFRDSFLLTNSVGKALVRLYYIYSPPIADFIDKHDNLRAMARVSLLPVVGVSWVALKIGPVYSLALMLLLCSVLIGFVGFRWKFKK